MPMRISNDDGELLILAALVAVPALELHNGKVELTGTFVAPSIPDWPAPILPLL